MNIEMVTAEIRMQTGTSIPIGHSFAGEWMANEAECWVYPELDEILRNREALFGAHLSKHFVGLVFGHPTERDIIVSEIWKDGQIVGIVQARTCLGLLFKTNEIYGWD